MRKMKICYIQTSEGRFFEQTEKGVPAYEGAPDGIYKDVCYITELLNGVFKLEYYDSMNELKFIGSNQYTNTVLLLYPSGIKRVEFIMKNINDYE